MISEIQNKKMEFESKDGFITKYTVIHFFLLLAFLIFLRLTLDGITNDYEDLENQNKNYFMLKELYEKVKAENNISYKDGDNNLDLEREIYYQEKMNDADETSMSIELRFLLIVILTMTYALLFRLLKRMSAKKDITTHDK